MEQKAFLTTWCRTCLQTRTACSLLECFQVLSRTNSTRKTIPCDVCEKLHVFRNSGCYEKNVCTRRLTHLSLLDDGVIWGKNIVFVCGSFDHFSKVFHLLFLPAFETMTSSKPMGVGRVIRWTRNSAERYENYYYESLAFSWQTIDLVFDEETMKPGA